MFTRLQKKWGLSARQFWIVFIAFGLTGCTTAVLTRYVTGWLGMGPQTFWAWKLLLRIGMLLLGYQAILLAYGALLGQWAFFWKYERKLLERMGILQHDISIGPLTNHPGPWTNLAIFASGAGSNAEKIMEYFAGHTNIRVGLVVCNKPGAGVIGIAERNRVPVLMIEKESFFRGDGYVGVLKQYDIHFVVLAGFLWKIPVSLIAAFPDRIINIHPALLPNYGGKGMYGMKVHEAVVAAGEKESGITIHYVNEHFDEGEPIFQAKYTLTAGETPESLAKQIHVLEHAHFPAIIENTVERKNKATD